MIWSMTSRIPNKAAFKTNKAKRNNLSLKHHDLLPILHRVFSLEIRVWYQHSWEELPFQLSLRVCLPARFIFISVYILIISSAAANVEAQKATLRRTHLRVVFLLALLHPVSDSLVFSFND